MRANFHLRCGNPVCEVRGLRIDQVGYCSDLCETIAKELRLKTVLAIINGHKMIDNERGLVINKRARVGAYMVECRERYRRLSGMAAKDSQVVVNLVNAEIDYAIALGEELVQK